MEPKKISELDATSIDALKDITKSVKFTCIDNNCYDYLCTESAINIDFSTYTEGGTGTNTEGLYSLYDELISEFPDYVSKTALLTASDELPIYRYDFIPPNNLGSTYHLPTIFYHSIHSAEVAALAVGVRFFRDLCFNWKSDSLLKWLRWNCKFTIIPVVSPYSLNTMIGLNANGVNLAQNFPINWVQGTEGEGDYGGTAPLSEPEAQNVNTILTTENFIFAIDHHTAYFYYDEVPGWVENRAGYFFHDSSRKFLSLHLDYLARFFTQKFKYLSNINEDNNSHFKVDPIVSKGTPMASFQCAGVNHHILNGWSKLGNEPLDADFDALQKVYTEFLGVIFYTASKIYE